MSTDDTKALAEIINGILKPDNAIRNEAVKKLETLRQNTPVLIYHLFKIIQGKQKLKKNPILKFRVNFIYLNQKNKEIH